MRGLRYEALGLAIGFGRAGFCEQVFEAQPPTGFGEGFGTVAGTVAGHDAGDVHAKFLEISDGGFQESESAFCVLIGKLCAHWERCRPW